MLYYYSFIYHRSRSCVFSSYTHTSAGFFFFTFCIINYHLRGQNCTLSCINESPFFCIKIFLLHTTKQWQIQYIHLIIQALKCWKWSGSGFGVLQCSGGVCLMQKESMKHVHQTLEVKTKKVVRTCNETDITREWRYVCADPMLTITA